MLKPTSSYHPLSSYLHRKSSWKSVCVCFLPSLPPSHSLIHSYFFITVYLPSHPTETALTEVINQFAKTHSLLFIFFLHIFQYGYSYYFLFLKIHIFTNYFRSTPHWCPTYHSQCYFSVSSSSAHFLNVEIPPDFSRLCSWFMTCNPS